MNDIVKRLRFGYLPTPIGNKNANADALEAADEIERLRLESHDRLCRLNEAYKTIRKINEGQTSVKGTDDNE